MKKVLLSILVLSIAVALILEMTGGLNKDTEPEPTINVIFDASSVSRISTEDLIAKMGQPSSKEDWINKTTKGNFKVSTYTYDKDNIHYEFIIGDNQVVRLSIYSNWTVKENVFQYSQENKEDIPLMFNITVNKNFKTVDNNISLIFSPVSNTVANFEAQDINTTNKTFTLVKITYNQNYFD